MAGKPARNLISSAGAVAEEHIIPRKNAVLPADLERLPRSGIIRG